MTRPIMKNVILFIVAAVALVVDANPSPDHHSHIAALLRRQLAGSSTVPAFDPSSIVSSSKCQSQCQPFMDASAVAVGSSSLSIL